MKNKDIRIRLAERIRQLRAEHELTQEKLAQRAGLSLYYIQILESRQPKKNATIITLEKLAHAFDMEVWQFLRW
ncbi:MAG: helix-turn-helix domain-containing protein [Candidatus Peribacteraceae bacterium]|nr:helix-turn-helix domain-containing protein [Candidatus Peribacteraceae bacterium]